MQTTTKTQTSESGTRYSIAEEDPYENLRDIIISILYNTGTCRSQEEAKEQVR